MLHEAAPMTTAVPLLTAAFLMLALGVRHGIDPEHIAIVNSMTMRAAEQGRGRPALCGLYFALGHGLVITAGAMALTGLLQLGRMPLWLESIAVWVPTAILFWVASINLVELLRPGDAYRPRSVKARFLPAALRDSSHPLAVFCIGVLFAPFVDPASQAAVWAYVVGTSGNVLEVAWLGSLLTASMAVVCVLGARSILLLTQSANLRRAERRRRVLGWLIVVFSYVIVALEVIRQLFPDAPSAVRLAGVLLIALLAGGALLVRQRHRRHARRMA